MSNIWLNVTWWSGDTGHTLLIFSIHIGIFPLPSLINAFLKWSIISYSSVLLMNKSNAITNPTMISLSHFIVLTSSDSKFIRA